MEAPDPVAQLESRVVTLMAMGSEFEEARSVAVLLYSLTSQNKYAAVYASISTFPESMATSSYVTKIFGVKCYRLKLVADTTIKLAISDYSGHAPAVAGRTNSER